MSVFLFASHPAAGHLNPLLAIARRLREDGHEISFVCSAPGPAANSIEADGFRRIYVRPSIVASARMILIHRMRGFAETAWAIRSFIAGSAHYARAIAKIVADLEAHVVVADFAFPGAALAAELQDIPYALIYYAGLSFKGPGIPPFGSGLPIGGDWGADGATYQRAIDQLDLGVRRTIERARRRLGLPSGAEGFIFEAASPWLNLVLTAEVCEAPRHQLPSNTFFVGPCADHRPCQINFPFEWLTGDRPKLYASLGTVFNDQPAVFRKIIDAFADGRYLLVVAGGRATRALGSGGLPDNVLLVRKAPQVELLPRVDAFISHGGNNSVNEALTAGTPLLVMPVGGEQGDNAAKVVYLGAGLRGDPASARPQDIRSKVDRLVGEPSFKRRAQEIAKPLGLTDGIGNSARLIGQLAATRAPVARKQGEALTVMRHATA